MYFLTRLPEPRDEQAQIIPLVAVAVLAFMIPFLVFVVDPAGWWTHKRHLQLQADAAAIAAGNNFSYCFTDANDSKMQSDANTYVGIPTVGSTYNIPEINQGNLFNPAYNSTNFPDQGGTTHTDACATGIFNVKLSEGLASLFGTFGASATPRAEATVAVSRATAGQPDMGLAVPDINPTDVAVTFSSPASCGGSSPCVVHLTSQGLNNGYDWWSGPVALSVPPGYSTIGLRVGLGTNVGDCTGTAGTSQYLCADAGKTSASLAVIRGFSSGGTATATAPLERAVWMTFDPGCDLNSATPFVSEGSGVDSCTATIYANIDWPGKAAHCDLNGKKKLCVSSNFGDMTPPNGNGGATSGVWRETIPAITVGTDAATTLTKLQWTTDDTTVSACNNKNCDFPKANGYDPGQGPTQQLFSGNKDFDKTGPVMGVQLSEPGGDTGSPYSLSGGTTHNLTVSVALTPKFIDMPKNFNSTSDTLLRFNINPSASLTPLVDCNTSGNWMDDIYPGCNETFQLNTRGEICFPTLTPLDCANSENGKQGNVVDTVLSQRFGCTTNHWTTDHNLFAPNDPRRVQLIITDFLTLLGNGNTNVPVIHLAYFYVTGWSDGNCAFNDPTPPHADARADVWGHFIDYADPKDQGGPPDPTCVTNPTGDACAVKLIK
jgi:hypothetical protein